MQLPSSMLTRLWGLRGPYIGQRVVSGDVAEEWGRGIASPELAAYCQLCT
jgi:hypothetical protein